jgi:hypothetical protein
MPGQISKIISLYTLRVLCFWRIGESESRTETEEKERKTSLNHSLVVIVCLWVVISLLVSINIAVQGAHRFYGPTGYCKFVGIYSYLWI